jgi:Amt family ammonium transporter
MLLDYWRTRRCTVVGAATGAVVGLVAITPAAGFVTPAASILIGMLAAGASYGAMQLRARTRVDDALDVFACHGIAGITGAMLTGVFATKAVNAGGADGLLAGNPAQLGVQALAVLATIALAGGGTAMLLTFLRAAMGIRLALGDEVSGIDAAEHGERAYHGGSAGELASELDELGTSVVMATERDAGAREAA